MSAFIKKILFVRSITAGLPSFARLIWNSKKLRWSKTGFIKASFSSKHTCIQLNQLHKKRALFLRTYEGDIDIFFEIFWKKIYELPQLDSANIKTIVDLGANIGLSALYFLSSYPNAGIICVEPEPSNFKLLSQNLSSEITNAKVQVLEAAVMGEDGMASFKTEAVKYNSKVIPGEGEKNTAAISMLTLIKRFDINHIDLLKVDVEAAEKYIFSADCDWLNIVDNIIIELHSAEDYDICMHAFAHHHFMVEQLNADAANEHLFWAKKIK